MVVREVARFRRCGDVSRGAGAAASGHAPQCARQTCATGALRPHNSCDDWQIDAHGTPYLRKDCMASGALRPESAIRMSEVPAIIVPLCSADFYCYDFSIPVRFLQQ